MPEDRNPDPFHAGEIAVQTRAGVAERAAIMGSRMIRPVLIDQHREFYGELPFLALGTTDAVGNPWASLVFGEPGFLTSPDERSLHVAARPVEGDPLASNLKEGADIGVLGMQLESRRRNRMNGTLADITQDGFSIDVLQSFGNCPKYIQTRSVRSVTPNVSSVQSTTTFDAAARDLIAKADTLFIATAWRDADGPANQGADVSHRGGKPGFVRVLDEASFVFPDFPGNNAYNTLGNLELNPRAGFLFADFERGDILTMTGTTEIIWDGPEVDAFAEAQRLIKFQATRIHRIVGGLGLSTQYGEPSPFLQKTGAWPPASPKAA